MGAININALELGVAVLTHTPSPELYKNDNIHPCVRYIDGGFAGHNWWMVTTPYPSSDSAVENPILYYADDPTSWSEGVVVEGTPSEGYNSDGCIYYDGTRLWVLWRENYTQSCNAIGVRRATFGRYTTDGVTFSDKKLFAKDEFNEVGKNGDTEMCPIVIDIDGETRLYGSYYEFSPSRMPLGLCYYRLDGTMLDGSFTLTPKRYGQLYYKGFDFWHFDLFAHGGKYYCVVSPENGDVILLGESDDALNFRFWGTPLLSNRVAGSYYLYKPSVVMRGDTMYLFHPNRVNGVNQIWMTSANIYDVIRTLDASTINIG